MSALFRTYIVALALTLAAIATPVQVFTQSAPATYTLPEHPTSRVLDLAGVLSAPEQESLTRQLNNIYHTESSTEVQVLIVPNLPQDSTLADFSLNAARKWQLGQKGVDNGLLITVVADTHKARIEVGYGLEGALPDGFVGTVIRGDFESAFATGSYYSGLHGGITHIQQRIHSNAELGAAVSSNGRVWVIVLCMSVAVLVALGLLAICGIEFAADILYLLMHILWLLIQIPIAVIGGGGGFGGGGADD